MTPCIIEEVRRNMLKETSIKIIKKQLKGPFIHKTRNICLSEIIIKELPYVLILHIVIILELESLTLELIYAANRIKLFKNKTFSSPLISSTSLN